MNESIVPVDTVSAIESYTPSSYSTITVTDAATRKMVLNAMNDADSLAEHQGPIEAIGFMCKPGVNKQTQLDGTVTAVPCTDSIIVCTDGKAYFTKSEGIRRSLDSFQALGLFSDGEPVQLEVVEKKLGGNRTVKSLRLL